ncbi:Cholinesterase [Holothuria leucospilota]|uniref:Carboxylic ester hydrolase n=1 Tax=Holothuria leucospilota TaxID=206669 RepID=A0A9Q1H7K1_HOLLE|nr:Cholinesterase [Holothuria leucospilota]
MAWRNLLRLSCIFVISSLNAEDLDLVEVYPDVGPIVGFRYQYNVNDGDAQLSKQIDTYLGIPFGEAPIGEGRFRKPKVKKHWTEPWNATFYRPRCWQIPLNVPSQPGQDEDCLYLNIWSPVVKVRANLSVMVWFHGGAFMFGSGSGPYYEGLPLAAFNEVVVVTLNYRLGVFGFLYAGTASPGNYGIWDQNLALMWVKDNIAAFGGDPNHITIFGQSAGGVSVGLHLVAKQSQDLFNRAILMSGSMVHPWGVELDKEKALSDSYQVGRNALCRNVESDQDLVDCLRGKTAFALISAAVLTLGQIISNNIPFVPVVDGELLANNPRILLDQGKFKQCDIMTGATKDDGSLYGLGLSQIGNSDPYANYTEFKHFMSEVTYVYNTPPVSRAIEQEYVDWTQVDNGSANYFNTIIDLVTDEAFYCPCDEVARTFRQRGNIVYKYLFNHLPSRSIYSVLPSPLPMLEWIGVGHAEDIPFLFGCPFRPNWPHNYTEEEKTLSLDMMRYFSNFAKNGDPNVEVDIDGTPGQVNWDEFDFPELKLMELKPSPEVINGYREDQCHFWNEHVLKLVTFTAGVEKVQEEWQEEFDSWRRGDVIDWKSSFDQYVAESQEYCETV